MKRKLVKQGAATLMVSIPAKWAKENNLDKGNEVNVEENSTSLIITSDEKTSKEIAINVNAENKKEVQNIITHAYRKGFEKIKIKGVDKETLRQIQNAVDKMLLGFEITSRSGEECIIENVSEPSNKKHDELLKRIFSLTKDTYKTIFENLESDKYESSLDVEGMREHVDKLILFCRRTIIKENNKETPLYWELLTFLMHIEHKLYYIYEYASSKKYKQESDVLNIYREIEKYYLLLEDAVLNKKINNIYKINNIKKEYYLTKIPNLLEKSSGKKSVLLAHINELYRLIQLSSSPALSIILNT